VSGASATVVAAVERHHLAVEVRERAEPEVAVLPERANGHHALIDALD
jgi:hypothetical protein